MPKIVIDPERCKGCELCVKACPQAVLGMGKDLNSRGYFYAKVAEPRRCIGCRVCCVTCPDVAIRMLVHGTMIHYFRY
ncbi:MAG: 4Fe-4S dicluster domain-containing protein [Deltaproteobacteria bacterium]|nr:4Fe-4S dicluster domain-containing protein [Deltaproteobacteria bacterium]